jgi:pimeloyl-ACP methyl ester carboxylesterase
MVGNRWKACLGVLVPVLLLSTQLTSLSRSGASTPPPDSAGIVYPLTSFLDWAENPIDNVTNPALGEYAAEQELNAAQAAITTNLPNELDPSALLGPNGPAQAEAFSEEMAANLIHLRPQVLGDDATDQANPYYLPDFDHNGVFGDPGDFVSMDASDTGSGYFLYPCIADTGAVTYETTTGTCAPSDTKGDTFVEGVAQREPIVSSRGLTLDATLWLPAAALKPGCPTQTDSTTGCTAPSGLAPRADLDHGKGLPTVVMSDGLASDQDSYFWLAMSLARAGYIVLTYDPSGQGDSEGSIADLFTPSVPNCEFSGACRDLQDVMHWLMHDPIIPAVDLSSATPIAASAGTASPTAKPASQAIHNPAYGPAGSNIVDPALGAIDPSKLAIVGHSMGALSLLNYLWYQGHGGKGIDGHPLPPIATGIALSGAAVTTDTVPVQFQTSDFDGSPTLIGPAVAGVDFGAAGSGIGYADMKPLYDQLRASGPGNAALELIVLEGGVHTDFIDTPFITRTPWSLAVSSHYATTWMGCYLSDNPSDCFTAITPVPHLSSSFASEASPGGPDPRPSDCITVPTTASLNDPPSQFISSEEGSPLYNCKS